MKRLFLVMAIVGTLVGNSAASSLVYAQSTSDDSDSGNIWAGLWAGANFDFSGLGHQQQSSADEQQSKPESQPEESKPQQSKSRTPAPKSTTSTRTYAALGDSVAAGLGLAALPNPRGTDTQCGRSTQAYPYQVARSTNMKFIHGACSGATVGDLFTKQAVEGPNITAQLDTAFAYGTPGLITITAGANDAHWSQFIRGCYAANCSNSATTVLANAYLVSLQAKLHIALQSVNNRSHGNPPQVILTGYYNPLSANCVRYQQNITAAEIDWLQAETAALNQTIADAAQRYPFTSFVPIDFTGHDICSNQPWVQGLADTAPFHPTAVGQNVIAQSVVRAISR